MNCVVPWNFSVSWNWFQFEIRKHRWRNKYFNLATNFGTLKKVTRKIENPKLKMNFFAYNRGTKQSDIEWYRPVIDHHMNFCERDRSLCKTKCYWWKCQQNSNNQSPGQAKMIYHFIFYPTCLLKQKWTSFKTIFDFCFNSVQNQEKKKF